MMLMQASKVIITKSIKHKFKTFYISNHLPIFTFFNVKFGVGRT